MAETLKASEQRRVLVVEDSSNWRNLLPRLYQDKGIEAVTAGSLDEAKELLKKGGFTEIVTDSLEGDWVGVVENSQGLPVRLLSGNSSLERQAQQMGVSFFDKGTLDVPSLLKPPVKPEVRK